MILEVQNGNFGYPKQKMILRDINLSLEEGNILAVLGPNGIGKTTLLKCITGLLPWKGGTTLFTGRDIRTMKPKELWSAVSYIPQSHGFAFAYTGLEMVMIGRSSHLGTFEQPGRLEIEMAEIIMEKIGITHLAQKDCNQMSGGELQMVLIARALINEPKLIILDEPETGLDFHNQILVLNMIERLVHEEGISAIMNTHYPANAMTVADNAFMMNRTGDFFYGTTAQVLNEKNISQSFDVYVVMNEFEYENRKFKSIVPVALAERPFERGEL
jgi:iron complex transport system ATP-binding protein